MLPRTAIAVYLAALVAASTSTLLVDAKNESKRHVFQVKLGNIRKLDKKTSTSSEDFAISEPVDAAAFAISAIPSDAPSMMPSIAPTKATKKSSERQRERRKLGGKASKTSKGDKDDLEEADVEESSSAPSGTPTGTPARNDRTEEIAGGSIGGIIGVEPEVAATEAPTEVFTKSTTNATDLDDDALFFNETDALFFNETEAPVVKTTSPGILIKLVENNSTCVTFDSNTTVLDVMDCDEAGDLAVWEIVESVDPTLMQLRHIESGLCLPENPELPDAAFQCWIDERNQAIADTINGLVDCSSPFAAFVGFIDETNPNMLYNAICSTGEIGADSDVILMAYTPPGASTQILWGEKILVELTAGAPFSLESAFFFEGA